MLLQGLVSQIHITLQIKQGSSLTIKYLMMEVNSKFSGALRKFLRAGKIKKRERAKV